MYLGLQREFLGKVFRVLYWNNYKMKYRIAKKIWKIVGTERSLVYTNKQISQAIDRIDRTRTARDSTKFWNNLMEFLGPDGRAEILYGLGATGLAFHVLMQGEGLTKK